MRYKSCMIVALCGVLIGFCGCNNDYAQREAEISEYNESVKSTVAEYATVVNKSSELKQQILNSITYNGVSDEVFNLLQLSSDLVQEEGELEGDYRLRCIRSLVETDVNDGLYKEYKRYRSLTENSANNGSSEGNANSADNSGTSVTYKYSEPYVWVNRYFTSASTSTVCEFMVAYFPNSLDQLTARIYWSDGKIVKIVTEI